MLLGQTVGVFGAGMIRCGHCGKPIVAEIRHKKTRKGVSEYRYYRCARYNKGDHPRTRLKEAELEQQVLGLLKSIRIEDEKVRDWFGRVLRAKTKDSQRHSDEERARLQRELSNLKKQKDGLLNLRLLEEINVDTFAEKQSELRDQEVKLQTKLEGVGRQQCERADLAVKVFELSQALTEKWFAADIAEKRVLLEIVCLNWTLDGVTLVPEIRKPFDILAKGQFVQSSRGDCPSFEPWIAVLVDTAFSLSAEALVASRVVRLSA